MASTTYTSDDTHVVAARTYSLQIECWGAGGSCDAEAGITAQAGAGGGGYAKETALVVSPGQSFTVTVGSGAVGQTGDSWFSTDSTVFAEGGDDGAIAGAGAGGNTNIGDVTQSGGTGGTIGTEGGGGGGEGADTGAGGNTGSNGSGTSGGAGGTGGGGGDGGAGGNTGVVGSAGSIVGGGGGGRGESAAGTAVGGRGQVVVTWTPVASRGGPLMA